LGALNVIFQKKSSRFFYGINSETYLPERERALLDYCYSYGYARFKEIFEDQKNGIDF